MGLAKSLRGANLAAIAKCSELGGWWVSVQTLHFSYTGWASPTESHLRMLSQFVRSHGISNAPGLETWVSGFLGGS